MRGILTRAGRDADYVEVGLNSGVCYNPLHNDLDPYAVAYAIATLLNNLFGRSKEPFWQQAYTDLLKMVISLRRITALEQQGQPLPKNVLHLAHAHDSP